MEKATIKKLLEAVNEIVDETDISWKTKAADILAVADDTGDTNNLEEFFSWFDKVES